MDATRRKRTEGRIGKLGHWPPPGLSLTQSVASQSCQKFPHTLPWALPVSNFPPTNPHSLLAVDADRFVWSLQLSPLRSSWYLPQVSQVCLTLLSRVTTGFLQQVRLWDLGQTSERCGPSLLAPVGPGLRGWPLNVGAGWVPAVWQ